MEENGNYVVTPTIESLTMGDWLNKNPLNGSEQDSRKYRVHLKLENTQPSASFKIRGISNLIMNEYRKGARNFITASGGNAGLAAAVVTRQIHLPLTVLAPSSISQASIDKLLKLGAKVEVAETSNWYELEKKAKEESNRLNLSYIPPFDHPLIWEGHASMIEECKVQLKGVTPDLVVVAVGGGGLLLGVSRGMEKVGWTDVPILATYSEATSMGGIYLVAEEAKTLPKRRKVILQKIDDRLCYYSVSKFVDDHLMLVEPSCGASLASVYGRLIPRLDRDPVLDLDGDPIPDLHLHVAENRNRDETVPSNLSKVDDGLKGEFNILIIVCGGCGVSASLLQDWKRKYNLV